MMKRFSGLFRLKLDKSCMWFLHMNRIRFRYQIPAVNYSASGKCHSPNSNYDYCFGKLEQMGPYPKSKITVVNLNHQKLPYIFMRGKYKLFLLQGVSQNAGLKFSTSKLLCFYYLNATCKVILDVVEY